MTQEAFVDSVDQDQNVQSDLCSTLSAFFILEYNKTFSSSCNGNVFLCPLPPPLPSAKTLPLAIAFEWEVMELAYFTHIFLGVKPFLQYQSQGQISRSQFSKKCRGGGGICVSQIHLGHQ